MNIITMASRKGGAGKSSADGASRRALSPGRPPHRRDRRRSAGVAHAVAFAAARAGSPNLRSGARGIERALAHAMVEGYEWALIDTAASMWVVAQEAIRAATMVLIPARPGFFDLNAVRETVAAARERNKPYAVVLNATPVKRDDKEAPAVVQSRAFFDTLGIPVWAGQVGQRTGFVLTLAAGASISEVAPDRLPGPR